MRNVVLYIVADMIGAAIVSSKISKLSNKIDAVRRHLKLDEREQLVEATLRHQARELDAQKARVLQELLTREGAFNALTAEDIVELKEFIDGRRDERRKAARKIDNAAKA